MSLSNEEWDHLLKMQILKKFIINSCEKGKLYDLMNCHRIAEVIKFVLNVFGL